MVSLNIKVNGSGYCSTCCNRANKDYFQDGKLLPIWFKDGVPQYNVPEVLNRLSHAEKMLIQRVSPFVPLHHIKLGVFGLSGHVCAFEQDITAMSDILPRHGNDAGVIRVIQAMKAEIGDGEAISNRAFLVRREFVLDALAFLKRYNKEFSDITIDPTRLNWIDGLEGDLDAFTFTANMNTAADDNAVNADMGPAQNQCMQPRRDNDDVHAFGLVDESGPSELSEGDQVINTELQNAVRNSDTQRDVNMEWPAIKDIPVSEYGDVRIFARAFPWLFPGGYGDIRDFPNSERVIPEWGKRLLYYEDGRFAKDKLFCFFALNYIIRHRNSTAGKFFIEKFNRDSPESLEELKQSINDGDTRFVNSLTYFNKRITGSSPYWFQKRSQLYSWINQHVELGNGAPSFFITLSCAEYFWPDIVQ